MTVVDVTETYGSVENPKRLADAHSRIARMPTSTPAARRFTVNTFAAAALALVALGVVGLGVSDYMRIQDNRARSRAEVAEAEAALAQVKYDENGNVGPEDRSRYNQAMSTMKLHTDLTRMARDQESNVYPFIGGGLLGFLVFTIVAVRSTRKPRAST